MKKLAVLTSFWLIVGLVVFGASGYAATGIQTPLPEDINIIKPDPSIGQIAKCSGIWVGAWGYASPPWATTIVLEKIDQKEVAAIYSVGEYRESWARNPGNWIRVSGKIKNESTIVLEWRSYGERRTLTLTLVGDDELKAEYWREPGLATNSATLTRVPPPAPKSP